MKETNLFLIATFGNCATTSIGDGVCMQDLYLGEATNYLKGHISRTRCREVIKTNSLSLHMQLFRERRTFAHKKMLRYATIQRFRILKQELDVTKMSLFLFRDYIFLELQLFK